MDSRHVATPSKIIGISASGNILNIGHEDITQKGGIKISVCHGDRCHLGDDCLRNMENVGCKLDIASHIIEADVWPISRSNGKHVYGVKGQANERDNGRVSDPDGGIPFWNLTRKKVWYCPAQFEFWIIWTVWTTPTVGYIGRGVRRIIPPPPPRLRDSCSEWQQAQRSPQHRMIGQNMTGDFGHSWRLYEEKPPPSLRVTTGCAVSIAGTAGGDILKVWFQNVHSGSGGRWVGWNSNGSLNDTRYQIPHKLPGREIGDGGQGANIAEPKVMGQDSDHGKGRTCNTYDVQN
ncbi:hypothetical protein C8R43DRAFT_959059 [Mycena crocata]|nr:hypothetical protein C8R43DRAFT_959059 [Mycena crocata]